MARKAPKSDTSQTHGTTVKGWVVLAHPCFLDQIERLVIAAEKERTTSSEAPGPNAQLLAHLLDLAFDKIPSDPGNPMYRHGGTLAANRRHWFRGKTGNGRYRLFFRFQSSSKLIVYAWVNDAETLRTYGSRSDAYAVFTKMLDAGNPPDDWAALVKAASTPAARGKLQKLVATSGGASKPK